MLPPEFDTPSFCKKSQDPVRARDENSSMHFTGQVARFTSQSSESSVNVLNHEPNSSSDASSMTFAISLSLGLDVPCLSLSTDSPTLQYEPLLAEVAPTELSKQAELPASSNQRSPSEQSVSRDAWSAFKVQNTSAGVFEIRQPAASSVKCVPTTQLIASDSQNFQHEPSPTEVVSIWIVDGHHQQLKSNVVTSANNPTPIPEITRTAEPSSRADQLPMSAQPIPAIFTIPFLVVQNPQVSESSETLLRPIRPKPIKDDSPTHPKANSERRYTCDICDKSFSTNYNLARHKRIHSGEKKFTCDVCPKSFTENYLFKRHMTIHKGEKKFACNFCNETFIRSGSLARHRRRHTGEKTFACHVCDKKFAREDILKKHTKTHAVEKNRVSRNDSPPAQTASVDVVEEQQACIDFSAYPNLVASDATIPVCVNTTEVEMGLDLRKHTIDSLRRQETLV